VTTDTVDPTVCPAPVRRPVMTQEWRDLASVHFPYPPDVVARVLPPGLEVDTFADRAWVGILPFSMRRIAAPGLPPVPWLGSFAEVNVRTYVVRDGVPGVWFCSLDVDRLLPAVVARLTYRIPYCWGRTTHVRTGDRLETRVDRRWPGGDAARARLEVRMGAPLSEPSDLDVVLSARWGLFSTAPRHRLRYAPVDHPPWPLRAATLERCDETLIRAAGFPDPTGEPHVLASDGVPVRIGLPRRA